MLANAGKLHTDMYSLGAPAIARIEALQEPQTDKQEMTPTTVDVPAEAKESKTERIDVGSSRKTTYIKPADSVVFPDIKNIQARPLMPPLRRRTFASLWLHYLLPLHDEMPSIGYDVCSLL